MTRVTPLGYSLLPASFVCDNTSLNVLRRLTKPQCAFSLYALLWHYGHYNPAYAALGKLSEFCYDSGSEMSYCIRQCSKDLPIDSLPHGEDAYVLWRSAYFVAWHVSTSRPIRFLMGSLIGLSHSIHPFKPTDSLLETLVSKEGQDPALSLPALCPRCFPFGLARYTMATSERAFSLASVR